ncbi:MAG: mitofilin family membrane protein [Parvibaculaceae bacterium]
MTDTRKPSKEESEERTSKPDETPETKVIDGDAVDVTGRNRIALLGAGLLGGVAGAALVGAGLLYFTPLRAVDQSDALDALSGEIQALEERMQTRTGGLYSRLSNAEEAVRRHTDQIGEVPVADRLSALQDFAAQSQNQLALLEDQLAAVDPARLEGELAGLQAALGAVSTDVRALKEAQLPADLPERVGAVAQGVNAAAEQINALSLKVAALEEALARPDPTAEAALGIALANLVRAVDAGQPFVPELNAIKALAPESDAVAALEPVAPAGVRSFASLKQQFADLVDPLLTAERQAGRETLWERLVGNALSIVTVRRVGDQEGDTVEAIVARIEARLALEDLNGALAEARQLSGPALEVAAPWIAAVEARVATEALVRELSSGVLALVAGGKE